MLRARPTGLPPRHGRRRCGQRLRRRLGGGGRAHWIDVRQGRLSAWFRGCRCLTAVTAFEHRRGQFHRTRGRFRPGRAHGTAVEISPACTGEAQHDDATSNNELAAPPGERRPDAVTRLDIPIACRCGVVEIDERRLQRCGVLAGSCHVFPHDVAVLLRVSPAGLLMRAICGRKKATARVNFRQGRE